MAEVSTNTCYINRSIMLLTERSTLLQMLLYTVTILRFTGQRGIIFVTARKIVQGSRYKSLAHLKGQLSIFLRVYLLLKCAY